jgi:medium-chain acyl-[acyl-carrier-protein] hydrolase
MKFSYTHRVSGYETDLNGIVSITSILRYAQEAANLQHLTYGPTIDEIRKSGKAFILSRVALDNITPMRVHDELEISTWLNNARGYGYSRYTQIKKNGIVCVNILAQWGVMDIESRHPLKVDEVRLGFGSDDDVIEMISPLRVKRTECEMQKSAEHTVSYGDCDENVHLNNAVYPLLFCNQIPTMVGKTVSEFTINYHREARFGEKFDILCACDNDSYVFKTILESGEIGAEAKIVLKDI